MASESLCVSVIIPVFNGERFLKTAIQSVLSQTYKSIEIIVVDDGSTDKSASIARSFNKSILVQQAHQGVASARNNGIAHAKGKWVSFLDADDFWKPSKIDKQMTLMLQNNKIDGTLCQFQNFFEPGSNLPEWINKAYFTQEKFQDMPSLVTLLIRKDVFNRVGLFNSSLEVGSDIDWFARARDKKIALTFLREQLVMRRLHDTNLSYEAHAKPKNLLKIFKASLDRKRQQKNGNCEK